MNGEWSGPGGVLLTFDAPGRIGDVLDLQSSILPGMVFAYEAGRESSTSDCLRLLAWCARFTLRVEQDGEPVEARGVADALDQALSPASLIEYAAYLADVSSLPAGLVEAAGEFMDLLAEGGCECRFCKGRTSEPDRFCAVEKVPRSARTAVLSWWPLRETINFSSPVWAYQLYQQWQGATSRAQLARSQRKTVRQHTRDRLSRMGINV